MKATKEWLATSGAEFSAGPGRSGCARLSHYTINYCEWGDGPPLVLVPGLAGGYRLLGPLVRQLAGHFRVIGYQLRGEDDCFSLRRSFGLTDLADDLAEFLDWHQLEAPAVLGISFGGVVALDFAARFPQRLDHLAIQGAGARFEHGLFQGVAGTVLSRYPLPPDSPFINQFFNLLFGGREIPGSLAEFVTRQCWQTDQSVISHRFAMIHQFDPDRSLARITAPTLVMAGDRDVLVSERSLHELCCGLSSSKLVRLKCCGHLGFVTQPARVAGEVAQFLKTTKR